jgi:ABC-type spermidine/putrescine transport system permease subunit II
MMTASLMRTPAERWLRWSFCVCLAAFLFLPILWLVDVSFQSQRGIFGPNSSGYQILPHTVTLDNFRAFILDRRLVNALSLSFLLFLPSAVGGAALAIAAIFRHFVVKQGSPRGFLVFIFSIFLSPSFAVFYAAQAVGLTSWAPSFTLCVLEGAYAYAIVTIILLLGLLAHYEKTYDQWLLTYNNRWLAYRYGIIRPIAHLFFSATLIGFGVIWSELYLANLLTTNKITKPFSVVIQGAVGQYYTDFGRFAVAALTSMLFPLVALACALLFKRNSASKD